MNSNAMAQATSTELSAGEGQERRLIALRLGNRGGTIRPIYSGDLTVGDYLLPPEIRGHEGLRRFLKRYEKPPRSKVWTLVVSGVPLVVGGVTAFLSFAGGLPETFQLPSIALTLVSGVVLSTMASVYGSDVPTAENLRVWKMHDLLYCLEGGVTELDVSLSSIGATPLPKLGEQEFEELRELEGDNFDNAATKLIERTRRRRESRERKER